MAELPMAECVVPTPSDRMLKLQSKLQWSLLEMVSLLPVFNSGFVLGLSCYLFSFDPVTELVGPWTKGLGSNMEKTLLGLKWNTEQLKPCFKSQLPSALKQLPVISNKMHIPLPIGH